jgi:hypothetical protein
MRLRRLWSLDAALVLAVVALVAIGCVWSVTDWERSRSRRPHLLPKRMRRQDASGLWVPPLPDWAIVPRGHDYGGRSDITSGREADRIGGSRLEEPGPLPELGVHDRRLEAK